MFNKHEIARNACQLFGGQAECGYDWWWHSFTAHHEKTGEEKAFFIEYFLCNPNKGKDFFVWKESQSGWVCLTCSYLMNECAKFAFRHIFWRRRHGRPSYAQNLLKNKKEKVFVGDIDVELYFATQHD